jgi:hypothetical protein
MSSGAVIAVRLRDRSFAGTLRGGAALLRVWLTATRLGLAGQVLAVLPLLSYRLSSGGDCLDDDERTTLTAARDLVGTVAELPPLDEVLLFFRVGRAPPPTARTARFPPRALLV